MNDDQEPALFGAPGPRASRQHGEILRTIGRLIDDEDSQAIHLQSNATERRDVRQLNIVEDLQLVAITWETPTGPHSRTLTQGQLRHLGKLARHLRSRPNRLPSASRWEEALRTLGQVLDTEEIHVWEIFENGGKFHACGFADDGSSCSFRYTADELRVISVLRSLLRSTAHGAGNGRPSWRRGDGMFAA